MNVSRFTASWRSGRPSSHLPVIEATRQTPVHLSDRKPLCFFFLVEVDTCSWQVSNTLSTYYYFISRLAKCSVSFHSQKHDEHTRIQAINRKNQSDAANNQNNEN